MRGVGEGKLADKPKPQPERVGLEDTVTVRESDGQTRVRINLTNVAIWLPNRAT
jgi:hypothetical protein